MEQRHKVRSRNFLYDLEQPGDWCFLRSTKFGIWLRCVCGIANAVSGRTIVINPDGDLSVLEKLICPACLAEIEIHRGEMVVSQSDEGALYSKLQNAGV